MYLSIETTVKPATDLGYLLHKNPDVFHTIEQPFGDVHLFYPVKTDERCQAVIYFDIDPIGLVRGRQKSAVSQWALGQYVNDRPYAVSSLMSVVINREFRQALRGVSRERQELANTAIPLKAVFGAVVCHEGGQFLRDMFEPLGYAVEVTQHPLDESFPQWGGGVTFTVGLTGTVTLSQLLNHLYVLIPVLDNHKHYWVNEDEIDKLLSRGRDWLDSHPHRETITRRYLKYQRGLTRQALALLAEEDDTDPDATLTRQSESEGALEKPLNLQDQRLAAIAGVLEQHGSRRVLDLGCGEGKLIKVLLEKPVFTKITGVDVSYGALESAKRRLNLKQMPRLQRERLELLHGSLAYRDDRFKGYDAAVLAEVIEHLDPPRLGALEINVFDHARPPLIIITTPNVEYNRHFSSLEPNALRHPDHRFEWTREEFRHWAEDVAVKHGYTVSFAPIGPDDPVTGAPTQMGVFTR